MAALTITPGSVLAGANSLTEMGSAGEAITAGQVVWFDSAVNTYKLADADSATVAARSPRGIALNGAGIGQPITVLTGGDVTIGATLVAGTTYYLSPTPGGIGPLADVLTGDWTIVVGMAKSTTVLLVDFVESGVML